MPVHIFEALDPISVIRVLSAIEVACGTNGIHESAPMWFFHLFMEGSDVAAASLGLGLKQTSSSSTPKTKEGMLRTRQKW